MMVSRGANMSLTIASIVTASATVCPKQKKLEVYFFARWTRGSCC